MLSIGKTASLQIIKEVDFGVYLDGGDLGEILLPTRYIPAGSKVDDWINVFIYLDSQDIIIATTEKPFAQLGECAHLEVVDTNGYGAFLDWGLSKDLLVPFKEQRIPMKIGKFYTVYIYEDSSGRICGSAKLDRFLDKYAEGNFQENQAVDILIATRRPIGYNVVIGNTHLGLLHNNDVLASVDVGERHTGYIKYIRLDDAIDVALQQDAGIVRDDLPQKILADLKQSGGVSDLTDKSAPEDIFERYRVSKANYKKALGQLYKDKKILLTKDKVTLRGN